MKEWIVSLAAVIVLASPAVARPRHHHVRTQAHGSEVGMPITAESGSIRINSEGQVISQPVPVIEKERTFDSKAQQELKRPAAPAQGGAATPTP